MINVSSIHNGSFPDFLYWDSIAAVQPRTNNDDYVYTYLIKVVKLLLTGSMILGLI